MNVQTLSFAVVVLAGGVWMSVESTDCNTDCSESCFSGEKCTNKCCCKGLRWCGCSRSRCGRLCIGGYLDPLCKGRCEAEKWFHCKTGLNSCDILYEHTSSAYNLAVEALKVAKDQGLTQKDCENVVSLGGGAYSGAKEAVKALGSAICKAGFIVCTLVEEAVKHAAGCACAQAFS